MITIEELKSKITDDTVIVSIMHANNEIGVIEPIESMKHLMLYVYLMIVRYLLDKISLQYV